MKAIYTKEERKVRDQESRLRWEEKNKDKKLEYRKKYYSTFRGKVSSRLHTIRRNAKTRGHTPCEATIDEVIEAYAGACEVCGREDLTLCIDHDHETGKFRGWLCELCNKALGSAKDSPKILRKLADYLEK